MELQGLRPTHWLNYKEATPFDVRVNVTVGWLLDGLDLAVMYFHEPDYSGHILGPESPGMIPVIQRMDGVLGDLMNALERGGLKVRYYYINAIFKKLLPRLGSIFVY